MTQLSLVRVAHIRAGPPWRILGVFEDYEVAVSTHSLNSTFAIYAAGCRAQAK